MITARFIYFYKMLLCNAVRSGAYSAGRLPWEAQEVYGRHCAEFANFYQQVGYVERALVLEMAANRSSTAIARVTGNS
jgi:hypothetical protein